MIVDIKEKARVKLCLREYEGGGFLGSALKYIREGYDAVCLVAKNIYVPEAEGIIPTCKYNIGNENSTDGQYTLIGIGMTSDPEIPEDWENMIKTSSSKVTEAIRLIHQRNGYAILAEIGKNKNTTEEILRLGGLDAVDVSDADASVCDMLAREGKTLGIICSGEDFLGSVRVESKEAYPQSVVLALKAGRFISCEGDGEAHISTLPSGRVRVDCSPASRIEFFTDGEGSESKVFLGEDLICAEYVPLDGEKFVRAEITDMNGFCAWTNYIEV